MVNAAIRANAPVTANVMKYDDAIRAGALAFFGDKYGDEVRVLSMGEHSTELCGGTHVARTGDIGFFKIVAEGGVAAGVRRVEAVTGRGALEFVQAMDRNLHEAAHLLRAPPTELTQKIAQVQENVKAMERELARLKSRLAASQGDDLAGQAVDVRGIKVLAATLEGGDAKSLRETLDQLKVETENRSHRARRDRRRQGAARRRSDGRHDVEGQGGRPRQLRRAAGRGQGRRTCRHGHGRRHRAGPARCGAGEREGVGRAAALSEGL